MFGARGVSMGLRRSRAAGPGSLRAGAGGGLFGGADPRPCIVKVLSYGKSREAARRILDYIARAHARDGERAHARDGVSDVRGSGDATRQRMDDDDSLRFPPVLMGIYADRIDLAEARRRVAGRRGRADRGEDTGFGLLSARQNLSPAARDLERAAAEAEDPAERARLRRELVAMPEAKRLRLRQCAHVMFSLGGDRPVDDVVLRLITPQFLAEQFPDQQFVWGIHWDHGHPHVHLLLGLRDGAGRRQELNPARLAQLREALAARARDVGRPIDGRSRLDRIVSMYREPRLESAAEVEPAEMVGRVEALAQAARQTGHGAGPRGRAVLWRGRRCGVRFGRKGSWKRMRRT